MQVIEGGGVNAMKGLPEVGKAQDGCSHEVSLTEAGE
jgi:hypothetical protein